MTILMNAPQARKHDAEAFVRDLKKWRQKHRYTLREAAEVLGVSNVSVMLWESGRQVPSRMTVLALSPDLKN